MYRPQVTPVSGNAAGIDTFLGYNHNLRIGSGEFYDMKNLTGDNYPVLTPRKARGEYHVPGREEPVQGVTGAVSHNGTIWYTAAAGENTGFLLYDAGKDSEGIYVESGVATTEPRTLIHFGAYILIFPDKKYYNTIDPEDCGDMEASFHFDTASFHQALNFEVLDDRGNPCTDISVVGTIADPADGCIAFDYRGGDKSIKRYNAATEKWVEVSKLYFRIALADEQEQDILLAFLDKLEDGDSLTVAEANYYNAREHGEEDSFFSKTAYAIVETLEMSDGEQKVFCVYGTDDMFSLISAWCRYNDGEAAVNNYITGFTIERAVPDMDFVLECNNRIWGCRHGCDRYGGFVNEIYASRQGNFKSWNAFAGISTDSYVASCGPAGDFTGAVNFNGYPLFFKQDHYWLMSGDYPAQYAYRDAPIVGVESGSGRSLAVVNRLLYYHAIDGVRVFDGYDSTRISDAFGDVRYQNAVGGTDMDKYYLSVQRYGTDEWSLFVYDAARGLWHKEDDRQIKQFFIDKNRLFAVTADGWIVGTDASLMTSEELRQLEGAEEVVEWMAETGNLLSELNFKYLKQLSVRMTVHEGAEVRFLLQYDDCGKWQEVCRQTATAHRFVTVPIRPRRCDHLRLRIEGKGKAAIYAIGKTYEKGSDVG